MPIYEQDQPKSDLFSMNLYYGQGNIKLQAPGQHNGNISWMEWRVKGENIQKYGFQYDPINRLEQAKYSAYDLPSCEVRNKAAYDVSISGYDAMGNIEGIRRRGLTGYSDSGKPVYGLIDELTLDYTDGLLDDITETSLDDVGYKQHGESAGISYENGNMTASAKQGIDLIEYNFLDLPTHVVTSEGIVLDFVYDANGNQLQMTKTTTASITVTDYQDGIELVNENLESIYFEEGRAVYDQTLAGTQDNPYLEWAISDHLGNVRVRYVDKDNDGVINVIPADDISSEITGSYHYYPFGMKMEGEWNVQQGNRIKYQYNGIEHLDDIGLSFSTYRIHDPALGRWMQVDPKAEALHNMNPFNAMGNNPIKYNDPNGDFIPQMLVGAGIGVASNGVNNLINGNPFFQNSGQAALYGAIGGAFSFGIGGVAAGISASSGAFAGAAFQLGAHGFLGGTLSVAQGGSFASGFASGAISSVVASIADGLGAGPAGMIGASALSGGISSKLAGGSFVAGARQGLITAGLNHAVHSGMLGEGLAVSMVTGKLRHILGPDAVHFAVGGEIGVAPLVELKFGKLLVKVGPKAYTMENLWEYAIGGGLDMGAGVEITNLYYNGSRSDITAGTFTGMRIQGVIGISAGVEFGRSFSYSQINSNLFVLGIGSSVGVGLGISPIPGAGFSGNITYGYSFIPQF